MKTSEAIFGAILDRAGIADRKLAEKAAAALFGALTDQLPAAWIDDFNESGTCLLYHEMIAASLNGFTSIDIWKTYRETIADINRSRYRSDQIRSEDRIKNHSRAVTYTAASLPINFSRELKRLQLKRRRQAVIAANMSRLSLTMDIMKPPVKTDDRSRFTASLGAHKAIDCDYVPASLPIWADGEFCPLDYELDVRI